MKPFSIVVAIDEAGGIGKQGTLAWHLPPDLKHFKEVTTTVNCPGQVNAVIMGRKTWESLPERFRPLPGRCNIVLSRQSGFSTPSGVVKYADLDEALKYAGQQPEIEKIFVIGGGQLFTQALNHPACHQIFSTCLQGNFHCDAFFPPIPTHFQLKSASPWLSHGQMTYRFADYQIA